MTSRIARAPGRALTPLAPAACLLLILGCGGRDSATLKGKVTYHNRLTGKRDLVVTGQITVYDTQGGRGVSAPVRGDGTYEATGLSPGVVRITFDQARVSLSDAEHLGVDPAILVRRRPGPVRVHPDYLSIDRTPLAVELMAGPNEHDIALLPLDAVRRGPVQTVPGRQ